MWKREKPGSAILKAKSLSRRGSGKDPPGSCDCSLHQPQESQRTSPILSDKLLWLSPALQSALCGLGGAGIRHPHRNFQTTLKIQPPSPPVTVSKQPVTTTTTPQQWHESLTAVATRELPSSSRFHFDGTDSSIPEGAPANDGRADTTPPRTGRGSSRPPVVSSVSFTSRSAEPPPSAVIAASSSPA